MDLSILPPRLLPKAGNLAGFLSLFCFLFSFPAWSQSQITIGKNGKTPYSIFIDPTAPASVQNAARDLKQYLHKTAGVSLPIVSSTKKPGGPFISLGITTAQQAAGLPDAGILHDGFKIITRGWHIFIFGPDSPDGKLNEEGGTRYGTANGVYTFLEDYAGVRWLMPGKDGEYGPQTKVLTVPTLNRTESSPFAFRKLPHTGSGPAVAAWDARLKLGQVAAPQYNHAWEKTIPASLFEQHPTWFAQVGGQHLPPVARHKLETTNPELVKAYADAVMAAFRKNPELKWHSLSPSDGISGGADWSDSPEAKALLQTDPNGKISRTKLILKFYNDVAKIVRQEFPHRKLGGYIYADYMYPPQDGIPDLEPNLALMLAPHINYGYQLYRPATRKGITT